MSRFAMIPCEAIRDSRLSLRDFKTLSAISGRAGKQAYPLTLDRIADDSGVHRTHIPKSIKKLQELGWISVKKGTGRTPNTYQINFHNTVDNTVDNSAVAVAKPATTNKPRSSSQTGTRSSSQTGTKREPTPYIDEKTIIKDPPISPQGDFVPQIADPNLDPEAWSDLHEYRTTHKVKKVRDSWTPLAQKKAAKLLAELTTESQRQCVDLTIANGWQGIFPDKLKNNGNRYAKQLTQSEINGRVTDELFGRNVDEPFGSDLFISLRTPLEGNTQNAGRGEAEIIDLGARLRIGKS